MRAIGFRSEEALIAAISSELVPASDLAAPVRVWRDDDTLWIAPTAALAAPTLLRLEELGARPGARRTPRHAQHASSWLEAVPLVEGREPDESPGRVLFVLPASDDLLDLAAEMIRLGCDRQRYQLGEPALLRVDSPPYFSVLRSLDSDAGPTVFAPCAHDNVWIQIGRHHPFASRVIAPDGEMVLIADAGWRVLSAGAWEDIDRLVDVVLPGASRSIVPAALDRRLQIALRLTTTGLVRPAALWVVRQRAQEQMERLLRDLPAHVVNGLLFAVGTAPNAADEAEEMVVLRAREGAAPMELALHGERYAPHPQLPSMMLPCDTALEPPLGRARLAQVIDPDGEWTSWLKRGDAGTFTVERAPVEAFRPLVDWVDYVISRGTAAIAPWVQATVFELDHLVRADLVAAEGSQKRRRLDEVEDDEPSAKKTKRPKAGTKKTSKSKRRKKGDAADVEPPSMGATTLPVEGDESDMARHVSELERRFLALDAPADADERLTLWTALWHGYSALGRADDAAHAILRVLWERPDDGSLLVAWTEADGPNPPLDAVLAMEWPSAADMYRLVLLLQGDTPDVPLERLARFVDAHHDTLDLRARWLVQLAVSERAGGDPLRLTRARDRALSELRAGLSLDRDVPSFIRARATGHGDLEMAQTLVAELERLWDELPRTTRARSAIEAPDAVTACYTRRLFASGFARLGRRERALALLAMDDKTLRSDAVHDCLLSIFDERVRQAAEGLSPTAPLSGDVTARLNDLAAFDRYKVDRLREASAVLEPVERLDAVRGFQRGEADPRGGEFALLRALDAGAELSARVDAIVTRACSEDTAPKERARLLDGAMDFFFALPVSHGTALLERLVQTLEPVELFYRAMLTEEALVLAAHFGHEGLIDQLSLRLASQIGELGPERASDVGGLLDGALRTLRRLGLRDRAAQLLEAMAAISVGEAPELAVARVHVAGGLIYLGDAVRALPVLATVHGDASGNMPIKDRLELARALTGAAALLPVEQRVSEIRKVALWWPGITDSFSTNSHFCLSVLHFVESLITGLVPPDRGRDGPASAYLDEDEHLVRRRIHRDLTEALSTRG